MSEQFREYAKEALDWALQSKTEKEQKALIYLAQTWALAAAWGDRPALISPPQYAASYASSTSTISPIW